MKDHAVTLAPVITNNMNLSLESGEVPKELKRALVTPLLKKLSLDTSILNTTGLCQTCIMCQKSWRGLWQHSCHIISMRTTSMSLSSLPTALLTALRQCWWGSAMTPCRQLTMFKQSVFLVLLDILAAFNTVNHSILPSMLQQRYGIHSTALKWLQSYLSDQTQDGGGAHPGWIICTTTTRSVCPTAVCAWADAIHPLLCTTGGNITEAQSWCRTG